MLSSNNPPPKKRVIFLTRGGGIISRNTVLNSLCSIKEVFICINPLTLPGEGVTVITSPYLSAGAPALGEAKGLIHPFLKDLFLKY